MRPTVVKRWTFGAVALALSLAVAGSYGAQASLRDAALCEDAASRAATATGVPREVLLAITLTETGRTEGGRLRPWPWAVNVAGEGHWFPTRAEAVRFVEGQIQAGASNFDVGCFQLNHRWHGQAFASADQMFDPAANALYAARYLKSLEAQGGDWSRAAGAYHSATPAFAERYRNRFEQLYAGVSGQSAGPEPIFRVNRYPLLQAGGARSAGSLVPMAAAARPLFGE